MNFIDTEHDRWQAWAGTPPDAAAPSYPLLSLEQWLNQRDTWPAGQAVGLVLPNDAELPPLLVDLPRITLLALQFPKWTDGRAYSQARLLRTRHRFAGELRATGEVLVDMAPMLLRTGFDAAVLRADQSLRAAQEALSFFDAHYQGDVTAPEPVFSPARAALVARAPAESALER